MSAAVLAVSRGREQLHQVHRPPDQLFPWYSGVDLGRPAGIGAGQHHRARRQVKSRDRADDDPGLASFADSRPWPCRAGTSCAC